MFNKTNYEGFLNQLDRLNDEAKRFVDFTNKYAEFVRIESNGDVTYKVNTSCHCHPEYTENTFKSIDFIKYLEKIGFTLELD